MINVIPSDTGLSIPSPCIIHLIDNKLTPIPTALPSQDDEIRLARVTPEYMVV